MKQDQEMKGSQQDRMREMQERERRIQRNLEQIRSRVVVFSGKGGVGKTTVAVNLSYALVKKGFQVGLLDADITGPNVPKMIGLDSTFQSDGTDFQPLEKAGLKVVSIAPLVPKDSPVIWRGPLRSVALTQFLGDATWGKLDFLVADLPPGTGDEVLTSTQKMQPQMAIVVTTPQEMALVDCRRAVNMAKELNVPKIGVVENMSGLRCPRCGAEIDLFGTGGGEQMAKQMGAIFLGKVPMEIETRKGGDRGLPAVLFNPEGNTAGAFSQIALRVTELLLDKPAPQQKQ